MQPPVSVEAIPDKVVNEKAYFGPLDVSVYFDFQEPDDVDAASESKMTFTAELSNGEALPAGFICTPEGELSGIAKTGTLGVHEIKIIASNEAGKAESTFKLTVQESIAATTMDSRQIDLLKAEAWKALGNELPVPDLQAIYERSVNALDVYYLLERWGTLTIYNAYDLEPPGEKKELQLEGASEHYRVFDRGCCLVACPKELFSRERTLLDGLKTARAIAKEAYKREWAVELIGFEKFTRAAWVELQLQTDQVGREVEIINYNPSMQDVETYTKEAIAQQERQAPKP